MTFICGGADKDWGILTNGRQWRLYHRRTSYRLDSFYEVDLAALLTQNQDLDAFRYFYNLFRRDAFIPDPSGTSFLDLVLGESQQYTVAVSDDLKNRVYDALRLLIGGFLDFPRNRFDRANPPLDEIQTNCLILLYRVLFTLYAESRGLLPVENPNYAASYSLAALAETIHETLDRGDLIIPTISDYWARLRGLFTLINDGWADLIPQYNGGLFNPTYHPFLEENELGNKALAQVIELLTRTEKGERIVYRDLDVRHLGDIYEGLLEYQPQIADQDLVIVSKKGSETVEPPSSPQSGSRLLRGIGLSPYRQGASGRRPGATTRPITLSATSSKTPSHPSVRARPLTKSYPSKSSIPPQGAAISSSALSITLPKSSSRTRARHT